MKYLHRVSTSSAGSTGFFFFCFSLLCTIGSSVRINEVADKGTNGTPPTCAGADWIELYNPGTNAVDLAGYILHDNNGPMDPEVLLFSSSATNGSTILQPGAFLVICVGGDSASEAPSAQFGIGGTDTITLLDATGAVVSSTQGNLDGRGDVGVTLAYDDAAGTYVYTTTPTPGADNVITAPPSPETTAELKARLAAQNELGTKFFNMDSEGLPLEQEGYPAVVDLRLEMDPESKVKLSNDERGYEVYSPFTSATVTAFNDASTVLLSMTSPGRIRPKGQSSMYLGVCTNRTTPYQIDWNRVNASQTMFGMERTILRTAYADASFVRDWASHRMLARFGLPHVRTRTVRLLMNGEVVGLYNLMEAPDQDYVFHRSFPEFDPENYGLYKVKTLSVGCGAYDEGSLARAEARINDTTTPPYVFERGEHRPKPPVRGNRQFCLVPFVQSIAKNDTADVQLAYVRSGAGQCGNFLVEQGLVDRDLGVDARDATAAAFVDAHLADNECDDAKCSNSALANDIDVTQFLRNLATQAAMLNQDSPLGNGNNYYLAYPGTGDGRWSMVQYDHNSIMSDSTPGQCDAGQCPANMIKWSILRPTCRNLESNQIAGPLLTDDVLRAEFVEQVRDFVNNVMSNEDLLLQIEGHLAAIKDLVAIDPWNEFASVFESYEMAKGNEWMQSFGGGLYVPFLPALRARATDIQEQLAALDAGTYPRESLDEYNPGEACADWTAESTPEFACQDNCYYDGCGVSGLVARSLCDTESGSCFKGEIDFDCIGVPSGESFSGSSPDDGFACLTFDRIPVYATPCAPYVPDAEMSDSDDEEMSDSSDDATKKKSKKKKDKSKKKDKVDKGS